MPLFRENHRQAHPKRERHLGDPFEVAASSGEAVGDLPSLADPLSPAGKNKKYSGRVGRDVGGRALSRICGQVSGYFNPSPPPRNFFPYLYPQP